MKKEQNKKKTNKMIINIQWKELMNTEQKKIFMWMQGDEKGSRSFLNVKEDSTWTLMPKYTDFNSK